MYVIIDWHILSDGNPQQNQKEALKFFKKMAKKYKNNTNVIYEICNEPNGGTSWSTIKKYAEKIIKGIRTYDKKAVILVGTPNWSQDVDQAALSPVSYTHLDVYKRQHLGHSVDWRRKNEARERQLPEICMSSPALKFRCFLL